MITIKNKSINFLLQRKNINPIHIANYLLIGYAFFLPLASKMSSILIIGIAFSILFIDNLKERLIHVLKDKVVFSFILFYLMYILWTVGSEHFHYAFLTIKDLKYILYIILIPIILRPEFINKILTAFLSAMLLSEILSYMMHFQIPLPFFSPSSVAQATPFMLSYTQYGTILSISLGIILFRLNDPNLSKYSKITYSLFFISSSTNIFIIGSRIAYILYFISISTVLIYLYRQNLKKTFIYITVFGVITYGLAMNLSSSFQNRSLQAAHDIQQVYENNFSTDLGVRTGYYLYSFSVVKNALFFGQGTADHAQAVMNQILYKESNKQNICTFSDGLKCGHLSNLHSDYLDISVQFGIIGLLIFLNIFYQIFIYIQKDPTLKIIQYIFVFTLLFVSIGSVIFIAKDIGKIFIFLIALTLNVNYSTFLKRT